MVKGGDDPGSGKTSVAEPLQGVQQGLLLGLVLLRNTPPTVLHRSSYDPLGIWGQPTFIIMKVEPVVFPPLV